MYTFELNIGSLSAPVLGSGWVQVTPVYKSASFEKGVEDLVRVRTTVGGSFKFIGVDALAIGQIDALEIPFRIKVKGTVRFTGFISRQGKINDKAKTKGLTALSDDQYKTILQNLDVEIGLSGRFYHNINQDYTTEIYYEGQAYAATGTPAAFVTPDNFSNCGADFPAAWSNTKQYTAANVFTGGLYKGSFVDCFVRYDGKSYAANADNLNVEPGTDPLTWVELDGPPGDVQKYGQERGPFQFDEAAVWNNTGLYWALAGCTADAYVKTWQSADLFSILSALLDEADDEITITAGTYCEYFNDHFPELLNLYLFTYAEDPKLKLSDLLKMYADKFSLFWKLDASKNFYLVHPTDISKTVGTGANDQTTYKSKNWTADVYEYEFKVIDEVKAETWTFGESTRPDFAKITLEYDNSYEEINEITDGFEADISTAHLRTPDFVLLCADGSKDLVNEYGIIDGSLLYNGKLSTSRLVTYHLLVNRPFDQGVIFGSVTVPLVQKRNLQVEINTPLDYPDEVEFDDLVKMDLDNVEVEKISIPLSGSISKIIANFK